MNFPIWPFILIGALISALVALHVPRKNRRAEAISKFRNSILSELGELYPEGIYHINGRDAVKILKAKHYLLNTAVEEFKPYVKNKAAFIRAWREFSGVGELREPEEPPSYNIYSFQGNHSPWSENPKSEFLNNVNKLLSFAKET